jgi:hypothetical protein
MGEPVRLRTTGGALPLPSGGTGRHRQRFLDNRTRNTSSPSMTHVEKALARQENLKSFGMDVVEGDIDKLVSDPEQLRKVKTLLSDREIEEVFGVSDPDEISMIRQSSQLTDVARARMKQVLKEREDGTRELEGDKNSNLFFRALEAITETLIGEEGSKRRKVLPYVPGIGETTKVLSGLEAGEKLIDNLNARGETWNKEHGYLTKEERQAQTEFSWGQELKSTVTGMIGLQEGGPKPWDVKGQILGGEWNIPFVQTNGLAAGVIADLQDMDMFGTPEGRAAAKKEFERLRAEGVDYNTAMLDSWRARDDIGWWIKEGIILGSDPSVIWGAGLAAAKAPLTTLKAYGGIKTSISGMKALKAKGLSLGNYQELKSGVETKILRGNDDDFWEGKDEALDQHARSILDKDEYLKAERAGAQKLADDYDIGSKRKELEELKERNARYLEEEYDETVVTAEDELMMRARQIREKPNFTDEDLDAVDEILKEFKIDINIYDDIPNDPDGAANFIIGIRQSVKNIKKLDIERQSILERMVAHVEDATRKVDDAELERLVEIKQDIQHPNNTRFWEENPDLLSKLTDEGMEGLVQTLIEVPSISATTDLLARVKPRTATGMSRAGRVTQRGVNLIDPSADIHNLPEGSIDRVVLESKVAHGRALDEGDAHLAVIMAQFRSMGEWFGKVDLKGKSQMGRRKWYGAKRRDDRYIFEIGEGKKTPEFDEAGKLKPGSVDKDEGRLWGITPRRGQKGRSVYSADVFSIGPKVDDNGVRIMSGKEHRNSLFAGLTDRQNDAIDMMQDYYQQMLKIAEREGLDLHELGSFDEAFAFISRKVKGDAEGLINIGRRSVTPGFFKSRMYDTMKEGVLDGKKYFNPMETAEMYGKAMYRLIADKRLQNWIIDNLDADYVKSTELKTNNPKVVSQYDRALGVQKSQDSAVKLMGQYAEGKVLTQAEKKVIRKAFPALAEDLDKLWQSSKVLEPESLVRAFKKAVKGKTNAEIRAAIAGISVGSRKTMSKTDVSAVLKELGVKLENMQVGTVELIFEDGLKAQKETLTSRIRGYQMKMMEDLKVSDKKLEKAFEKRTAAKEKLRTLGPGEASPSKVNITFKGEGAQKAAADIDKWLNDSGYPALKFMTKLNDAIRLMKTGWDFGVFFIQGLPILFRDPETWGKAMGTSIASFVDEGVRARYIADNAADITDFVKHGGHIGSTEMTQSMESGGWFAKLPTLFGESRQPVLKGINRGAQAVHRTSRRFQSQYDTFLDVSRFELYKSLKPTWLSHGKTSDLDDLADFINKITGHTSTRALGVGTTQRELEGALFLFSPRYTRATASLFLDMSKGGLRGHEARKSIAHLMVSQYALHMAASAAMGQEPNLTPGTGRWLKTEIPGVGHIGFGGKPNAIINMATDITTQLRKNPEGFMSWDLWSPETYEENAILKRLRYQTSPVSTTIINMVTGVDPIGRTLPDWKDIWLDDAGNKEFDIEALKARAMSTGLRYLPFMVEGWHESGPIGGIGEFVGAAVIPERSYEARDALYDKYSRQDLGISYQELRNRNDFETQKSVLEQAHPDLKEAVRVARDDERNFKRNDERMVVRDTREHAISYLATEWDNAANEFKTLGGSGREFRKAFWDANTVYGEKMKALRTTHPDLYADMNAYYEGKGVSSQVQAATNAFMDRLFSAEAKDWFGNTDYAAIDRIKSELNDVYGADVMRNVDRNFTIRMKERAGGDAADPIVLEFINSIEGLRKYWDIGRNKMSERDWRLWLAYENSSPAAQEALRGGTLKDSNLDFESMEDEIQEAREELQESSPDIDRWLVLFYGKEALNEANVR